MDHEMLLSEQQQQTQTEILYVIGVLWRKFDGLRASIIYVQSEQQF